MIITKNITSIIYSNIIMTVIIALMTLVIIIMSVIMARQNDTMLMMEKCLNYSDNILDMHEIWDKDGSDYMSNYINLRQELDSTFLSTFHKKYNE